MRAKADIEADIVNVLRAIMLRPGNDRGEQRTLRLRELAELTVEYREHFLDPSGAPDWTGRTFAYRKATKELYSDAGIRRDEVPNIQKLARYHLAYVLRERLSAEEIASLGLREETPSEYMAESRKRTAAQSAHSGPETAEDYVEHLMDGLEILRAAQPPTTADAAEFATHFRTAKRLLNQIVSNARAVAAAWPAPEGTDHTIA
jgi:hypothetical protein